MPEIRTIHSDRKSVVLFQTSGKIRVVATPDATGITVEFSSPTSSGVIADAIREASVKHVSGALVVRLNVPTRAARLGSAIMGGSPGLTSVTLARGQQLLVNGVDVTRVVTEYLASAAASTGNDSVETVVTVPTGWDVDLSTVDAEVTVGGALGSMNYVTDSGRLVADSDSVIMRARVLAESGPIVLNRVAELLWVSLTSGRLDVRGYDGKDADITITSGTGMVDVSPIASGRFKVKVGSGGLVATGTAHLDVEKSVASGKLNLS